MSDIGSTDQKSVSGCTALGTMSNALVPERWRAKIFALEKSIPQPSNLTGQLLQSSYTIDNIVVDSFRKVSFLKFLGSKTINSCVY